MSSTGRTLHSHMDATCQLVSTSAHLASYAAAVVHTKHHQWHCSVVQLGMRTSATQYEMLQAVPHQLC